MQDEWVNKPRLIFIGLSSSKSIKKLIDQRASDFQRHETIWSLMKHWD